MDFLAQILRTKAEEIQRAKLRKPLNALKDEASGSDVPRDFMKGLKRNGFAVIAEIKKASPSRGVLAAHFDHRWLAEEYEQGGAQALSVLTDETYFQGAHRFVREVKEVSSLPVLRKDFILDEYQVYESRSMGADALLLIVRALAEAELRNLYDCARSLGMSVIVEVHDLHDVECANRLKAEIIGINNRNLTDFDVSMENSLNLRDKLWSQTLAVSESGIKSHRDVQRLRKAGFHAVLVGEGVVTKSRPSQALRELMVQ